MDKGEYNSTTTRVLHFIANPETEARKDHQLEQILQLESEVATLKLQNSLTDAAQLRNPADQESKMVAASKARAVIAEQKVSQQTHLASATGSLMMPNGA